MIAAALERGFEVLVLTNAMRPMRRFEAALDGLAARAADDAGQPRSSQPGGARGGARRRDAGPRRWTGCAGSRRTGSGPPSPAASCPAKASTARRPAMPLCAGAKASPPRPAWSSSRRWTPPPTCPRSPTPAGTSSTSRPGAMMCASSRMVVKAKGRRRPHVVACTLLPYDPQFALGPTLADGAARRGAQPSPLRALLRARGASCSASPSPDGEGDHPKGGGGVT